MTVPAPLVQLLHFLDGLHERVERTWWGTVATDSRFPLLWEANYAAIEAPAADLSLREVREALLPALREAGATHEHIWIMEPEATGHLLHELARRGRPLHWDSLMWHGRTTTGGVASPEHPVEEVLKLDGAFWELERLAMREFGITEPSVVEQVLRRHRDVLVPAGKRWFTVRLDGAVAGVGSLLVHGGAAYVDDVATFPPFRRRGVARSVGAAMIREADEAGAEETYLFADQPGPIRLYQGLGFEVVSRVVTVLEKLPEPGGQAPGTAADPDAADPHAAFRPAGSGPGRPR